MSVRLSLRLGRGRVWVANRAQRMFWEGTVDEYCAGVHGVTGGAMASGAGRPVRVSDTFGRLMGCMLGALPGAGVESSAEYRQLDAQGWPLRSVYHGAGGASGQSSIVKAERRDIAEQEFTPPSGYRRAPFAEVFVGPR